MRNMNVNEYNRRLKESWSNSEYAEPCPEPRWIGIRAINNAPMSPAFLLKSVFPIK